MVSRPTRGPRASRSCARDLAITSDMIVTAPAASASARSAGRAASASRLATMIDYYHMTRGGRVVFGKGGWGSRSTAASARISTATRGGRDRRGRLPRYYPGLADVAVTHDWSGPIDRTPNSLPLLGRLGGREHIVTAWGGAATASARRLGGKILASLALGRDDEWCAASARRAAAGSFPPEPSGTSAPTSCARPWRPKSRRRCGGRNRGASRRGWRGWRRRGWKTRNRPCRTGCRVFKGFGSSSPSGRFDMPRAEDHRGGGCDGRAGRRPRARDPRRPGRRFAGARAHARPDVRQGEGARRAGRRGRGRRRRRRRAVKTAFAGAHGRTASPSSGTTSRRRKSWRRRARWPRPRRTRA